MRVFIRRSVALVNSIEYKLSKMIFVRGFILTSLVLLLEEVPVVAGQCAGSTENRYLWYSGGTGSIKIPDYPNTEYGNNLLCKWRIRAPPSQRVLVYFTFFDLRGCCSCDYVKIQDGSRFVSYSNVSKLACGRELPEPVYSSGRYLYITFQSDAYNRGKGFVAQYRALSSLSGCPSIDTSASFGVIYSPRFPWNYPNDRTCTWKITVPSWKKITLNFTHFDLEGYFSIRSCYYDYVEVRSAVYGPIKYCGTRSPLIITRYGSVNVTFYSNSYTTRSGFLAFYQKETSYLPTTYPYYTFAPTTYPYHFSTSGYHSVYTCNSYQHTIRIYVGKSSGSKTIQSPNYNGYYYNPYPTSSSRRSCSYEIDTAEGYVLRLTFVRMSISSCSGCSCGYVQVYENSNSKYSSASSLLGKFCNGRYPTTLTTRSNKMSVFFNGYYSYDKFQATVVSEKEKSNAAAIAVPIAIAVVLFTIIFIVIKCTKVKRSAATPTGSRSTTNVVSLQTFNAPVTATQSPPQNTEEIPPSYQEATDHTQGVTNMPAMPRDTGHL